VDVGLLASWGNFELGAAVLHSSYHSHDQTTPLNTTQ